MTEEDTMKLVERCLENRRQFPIMITTVYEQKSIAFWLKTYKRDLGSITKTCAKVQVLLERTQP